VIIQKSPNEIEIMTEAGRITARALRLVGEAIRAGMRTKELDAIAERAIRSQGATPAFLGYQGFPASVCTSINDQVVHGIPGKVRLVEGDIISIDIGAVFQGYYGDSARTFPVGQASEEAVRLMDATERSLWAGIEQCVAGNRLYDISHAVQTVAEGAGFSVVREYVGHGIGRAMHEEPQIPNYGPAGKGPELKEGMVFAIEPMINAGGAAVRSLQDGWTVVTVDGSLSAHFEHTIAITPAGPVVLTKE
jgi:methionyl aminopeptidase